MKGRQNLLTEANLALKVIIEVSKCLAERWKGNALVAFALDA